MNANATRYEIRGLLILAAACAVAYLLAVAAAELLRQQQRAEVSALRADLAAWQVAQLMEEARDITRQAAQGRGAGS